MVKVRFSDDFKRDTARQIVDHGYPVTVRGRNDWVAARILCTRGLSGFRSNRTEVVQMNMRLRSGG
jgi:hypothetical protein